MSVCTRCLLRCQKPITLECKHDYHKACLIEWVKDENVLCKLCGRAIRLQRTDDFRQFERRVYELERIATFRCGICSKNGPGTLKLKCGHEFHNRCLKIKVERRKTCPVCKEKISIASLRILRRSERVSQILREIDLEETD